MIFFLFPLSSPAICRQCPPERHTRTLPYYFRCCLHWIIGSSNPPLVHSAFLSLAYALFLYFGSWSFLVRRSPFLPNTPPQPVASPLIRPCFCRWFLSCCLLPVCVDVHHFALWHAVMWRVTKASVAAQINIPPQVCTCSKRKYAGAFRAAACYLSYIAVVTF